MIFDPTQCITACERCIDAYSLAQTGSVTLPAGWREPRSIISGNDSSLLRGDPMKIQGYETFDPAGRQWIVFRGTQDEYQRHCFLEEWVSDLFALPMRQIAWGGIHAGAWQAYWYDIYPGLIDIGIQKDAIVTGHSRGAWFAALLALGCNLDLICIEGPKPGDAKLASHLKESIWVHNKADDIPNLPRGFGFEFAGQQIRVDGPGDLLPFTAHNPLSVIEGLRKLVV